MAFYDLTKQERYHLVERINQEIENDLKQNTTENITIYFSDDDTYIRKTGYLAIGKSSIYNHYYNPGYYRY